MAALDHGLSQEKINKNLSIKDMNAGYVYSAYHLFSEISPKQYKVLEMFACGFSRHSIATRLEITPRTVKYHLEALRVFFEVSQSSELRPVFFSRIAMLLLRQQMEKQS